MKIKCYYRKNLKLSPEKLASQVGHVTKELGRLKQNTNPEEDIIIVLGVSDNKFNNIYYSLANTEDCIYYLQVDLGYTEVEKGTATVIGYIQTEEINV